MTISATQVRKSFTGDGSTTAFTYNYRFLANGDLKVYLNGTLKTITTHYTVTGAGDAGGGTVTFLTAPAVGDEVVIINDPSNTQSLDLVDNDIFPAESLEQVLDRLTLMIQRCRDLNARAVTLSDTDLSLAAATLPSPVADQLLAWNSTGTALTNVDVDNLGSLTIGAGGIITLYLADGVLSADVAGRAKMADGFVTAGKLASSLDLTGKTVSGTPTLPAASTTYAGAIELATDAEAQAGTDSARGLTPANLVAAKIQIAATQATTSGTYFDFSSIPSWAKRITVAFNANSHSGTSEMLVQIGDSGGLETSGYAGSVASHNGSTGTNFSALAGFQVSQGINSSMQMHGHVTLVHMGNNLWSETSVLQDGSGGGVSGARGAGSKTLSGTLDRLRVTTVSGDTFDNGSLTILIE